MSYLTLTNGLTPGAPASSKTRMYSNDAGRLSNVNASGADQAIDGRAPWNLLRNSGFWFAQRQDPTVNTVYTTTAGQRGICADAWAITGNAGTNQFYQREETSATRENVLQSRFYGCFNIGTAGPDRMIASQIVNGIETDAVRGRLVRFTVKCRAGSLNSGGTNSNGTNLAMPIQLAMFSWAGTVDSGFTVIIDTPSSSRDDYELQPHGSWSYINPARSSGVNCTALEHSYAGLATGHWQVFSGTFQIPTTSRNVMVLVYPTNNMANNTNNAMFIGDCLLTDGEQFYDYTHLGMANEYIRVAQFYQKSFNVNVKPIQNASVNFGEFHFPSSVGASAAFAGVGFSFPVRMYKAPTTLTLYNPAAANAQIRNVTLGTDCTVSAITANSETGAWLNATTPASTVAGNNMAVNWTADGELV